MHELGIAGGILDLVRMHVPAELGGRVRVVHVRVGEMAGVVPESLDFCFGAIIRDTPYEQAELVIERVPARAVCRACGSRFDLDLPRFACPACGDVGVEMVEGRELQVMYLELADDESGDRAVSLAEEGAGVS